MIRYFQVTKAAIMPNQPTPHEDMRVCHSPDIVLGESTPYSDESASAKICEANQIGFTARNASASVSMLHFVSLLLEPVILNTTTEARGFNGD